ncbi:MAG: HAD family phosphatase [Treponema sp.]|nr:HAD family phosphatase [Treponema sp.]
MIEAVIFDMDGVIFDSERISRMAWDIAGKEYGISDVKTAVRECTGVARPSQWVYLKNKYGQDFPAKEFRERCSEIFHKYTAENGLPVMPYARETLEYLKGKGYRLAIASSSKTSTVIPELTEAKLLDYFEKVTCGDMVEHSKPHPEIYAFTAEAINATKENCIAVEDSPNGIRSAHAAGLKPVMVPDQIQPDEEIKKLLYRLCTSLNELRDFL